MAAWFGRARAGFLLFSSELRECWDSGRMRQLGRDLVEEGPGCLIDRFSTRRSPTSVVLRAACLRGRRDRLQIGNSTSSFFFFFFFSFLFFSFLSFLSFLFLSFFSFSFFFFSQSFSFSCFLFPHSFCHSFFTRFFF